MFEPGNQLARKPEDQLSQTQDAINGRKRHAAVKAKTEAERVQAEAEADAATAEKARRQWEAEHAQDWVRDITPPDEIAKIEVGKWVDGNCRRRPGRDGS